MKKLISIIALIALATAAQGMDYKEVYGSIKQHSNGAAVGVYDPSYASMSEGLLKKIIGDHYRALRLYAPKLFSGNELFDCDDYAFTFKSSVSYYGLMLGNNYLCGVLIVKQAKAFGGVPAVGYHALNVILLDGVLYVLEPQTYKLTPLSEYPNRDNIISLII